MARRNDLGFTALKVEGGLLPPEFLRTVASLQAGDQEGASYGLTKSLALRDEIGRHWRIASDLWSDFRTQRVADRPSGTAAVDRWLAPLLSQALGFTDLQPTKPVTLGERTFPLTHRACKGAVPLVLLPPSFDLDKACEQCGEEGRRRTPWGLIQEWLNASDGALWGLVANGLTLRILRDNPSLTRPAWIELDLERLFEDEVFSDFAAFWLLAHGSRFLPREAERPNSCILERWRGKAHETGERARGELRKGVTRALVTLGNGLIGHPANDELRRKLQEGLLTPADLHQQLLRLVYRCLFLLTIEDRDLLHPPDTTEEAKHLWREGYSIAQLRERALRPRAFDRHGDLWHGLSITFAALEKGAPAIAAPALGGLFERKQTLDLVAAELTNAALLGAIKALAFFAPKGAKSLARINYRDMNTEEFGSVYESLLELHPYFEQAPWGFGYVGLNGDTAKGTERKLSGSYYTPASLVQELIKSALEPVVRKTATDHPYDQRTALLGLKIVDPACGSGHFLLAAARRLAAEIARIEAAPDAPTEALRQHALREVVQHCIYGVDKNPLAVELCKTALWIETIEPGKPLSFLDHRIREGDSLIGVFDFSVLQEGIPDGAYKAKTGDDKAVTRDLKKRNKDERKGQHTLGFLAPQIEAVRVELARAGGALDALPEDDASAVARKASLFQQLHDADGYRRLKDACDLWTAAFFAELRKPEPGKPDRIPTTDAVREALAGQTPQALRSLLLDLDDQRFFHWPLEFPEVFAPQRGDAQPGFDVVLGNPPWEVLQLSEEEFFAGRDNRIASAANKAAREKLIKALACSDNPADSKLHADFETAMHDADAQGEFVRGADRFPLTAVGKLNTYAIFAETFLRLISRRGRAGMIVPTGILSDDTTKLFYQSLISGHCLYSAISFENEEFLFPGIANVVRYTILTMMGSEKPDHNSIYAFYLRRSDQMNEKDRFFSLTPDDIVLLNPNTQTCPIFRTSHDAELTKKIYRRVPVLIDESKREAGNPWGISFRQGLFNMATDSGLFRYLRQLAEQGGHLHDMAWLMPDGERYLPLYEGKFVWHYNHRFGSYHNYGKAKGRGGRGLPPVTDEEYADPTFRIQPRYWVSETEIVNRLQSVEWEHNWLLGWRDVTSSKLERTVIANVLPRVGVNHKMPLFFTGRAAALTAAVYANFCSLVLDFVARQKVGGTSLTFFVLKQLPVLLPSAYGPADLDFIVRRVLELTYTAWDMQPFARDLGYEDEPHRWDPKQRAILQAELDAYYAWLYGLTRDELRYVLDPKDVMGEDFPSETFRVLKEREIKEHGEYRTRRLVLDAFDRFHEDGTFDAARVHDPHYMGTVTRQLGVAKEELALTRAELEEARRTLAALMSRADRDERPTLFVEGATDAPIIEAAWRVFFPDEPMPFKVEPAGGTTQMRSLAAPGKALQSVLGDRLIMALADNDGEGRDLWREGKLHQGGSWRQQTNGVWWCLLPPTDEFRQVMEGLKIDRTYWPFTVESAFAATLRAQALAEGAYGLDQALPQADFLKEQRISKLVLKALADLPADDPAVFYLRPPTPDAKTTFAAWITDPTRLTRENYAAFEPILTGLRDLVDRHTAARAAADPPRQARLM